MQMECLSSYFGDATYFEDMELAELWVLADKMAIPALQNLVVRR
jgi:hypothetical protein